MGQIRTVDCKRIDEQLRAFCPGALEIETQKDTYSEDYIVWVTINDSMHPIRITIDEYRDQDWQANVALAISELSAESAAGEHSAS